MKSISVVGLGKLGAPLAVTLANRGFEVVGVDLDMGIVDAMNRGEAHIVETGYEQALRLSTGRAGEYVAGRFVALSFTWDAVRGTDATIIMVPTPSQEDGSFTNEFILSACQDIGRGIRDKDAYHLVVVSSTVMPGSCGGPIREALEDASGKVCGEDFGLVYSPEFVALGDVIEGFTRCDFVLIGESDEKAGNLAACIYRVLYRNFPTICRMSFVSAEIAKIALNSYITMKMTFANELARLCEQVPGAHVDTITDTIGRDHRIGRAYLTGAVAYGGPCFPRDNRAFCTIRSPDGVEVPEMFLAQEVDHLNELHAARLFKLAWFSRLRYSRGRDPGTVGVLGLAYKPGAPVTEESVGLYVVRQLQQHNSSVIAYDPLALPNDVDMATSAQACADACDVLLITLPDPEYRVQAHEGQVVIDGWRLLDGAEVEAAGAKYVPIGVGT